MAKTYYAEVAANCPELTIEEIPIAKIDVGDLRFQFRVQYGVQDLTASLRKAGQQVPVVLWAVTEPLKIIDGFRRIEALRRLGKSTVQAIVRRDIDEAQALSLAFIENVKRKNFSGLDRAHAVWICMHTRGMSLESVARELGLSERQIHRYRALMHMSPVVLDALEQGRISMAHAVVLNQCTADSLPSWLEQIERHQVSAKELQRRIPRNRRRRPKRLFVKDGMGFQLRALHYRPSLPMQEQRQVLEVLEAAAELIRRQISGRAAGTSLVPALALSLDMQ